MPRMAAGASRSTSSRTRSSQLRKYKGLADGALAQVADADLFRSMDAESNSIADRDEARSGNMRSRWTDFLTTDGEKPDRDRDAEFESEPEDTRASIFGRWEGAGKLLFAGLKASRRPTLADRGDPGGAHTVLQAIHRQLTHYAYHVGQIVFLARHFAGPAGRPCPFQRGGRRNSTSLGTGGPIERAVEEPDEVPPASLRLRFALCAAALVAAEQPLSHAGCAATGGDTVEPALLERPTAFERTSARCIRRSRRRRATPRRSTTRG